MFLAHFYTDAFNLYINGNGGFVGFYLNQTFLNSIISINKSISYYILIILIIILFLISINFHPVNFYKTFSKLFKMLSKKKMQIILIKVKL